MVLTLMPIDSILSLFQLSNLKLRLKNNTTNFLQFDFRKFFFQKNTSTLFAKMNETGKYESYETQKRKEKWSHLT